MNLKQKSVHQLAIMGNELDRARDEVRHLAAQFGDEGVVAMLLNTAAQYSFTLDEIQTVLEHKTDNASVEGESDDGT